MHVGLQRLRTGQHYTRLVEWSRLLAVTGSAQVAMQAIGFVCGILVIRLLPTPEYALYTLANTMLGTMVLLADAGIATGVIAQGGKVWQDRTKLGIILATGFALRRRFAIVSLCLALPALLFLLRQHGASWLMGTLLALTIIPVFLLTLSSGLLEIGPKLRQEIIPLQKNQVAVNLGRLAVLVLILFIFPWAFVAILAAGLPQLWGNLRLRKISDRYADASQAPDPVVRQQLLVTVRRLLPGAIYYSASGQITIWLVSLVGSTAAIAQVGALGRLATVINLFGALFGILIAPRFARMPAARKLLVTRYVQIQLAVILFGTCLMGAVWFFPQEVLWILGKGYSDLSAELIMSIAISCLGLLASSSFVLYSTRGWAINPLISIGIEVLSIVGGILLLDISSLIGILTLNIFIVSIQVVMNVSYGFFKLLKIDSLV